jgi:uncharacterized phage protein (TIGR01671 family)
MTPKFRAWLIDHKEMRQVLEIAYWACGKGDISFIKAALRPDLDSELFIPGKFVLMQSTGLLDCNGKEIYEGDIMLGHTHEGPYYESNVVLKKVVVVWDSPTCSFRYRDLDLFFGTPQKPHTFLHEKEIVGNIYENPECLPKDMAILNFLFNLKAKDYQEFLEKVHKND